MQLKEFDVIEMVEKVTNPNKDEGEWIMAIDLLESGDKLLVKEMEQPGTCRTECKTVQRAAEEVVESADTDMAEKLWQVCMFPPGHHFSRLSCSTSALLHHVVQMRAHAVAVHVDHAWRCCLMGMQQGLFSWVPLHVGSQCLLVALQGKMSRAQFSNWLCTEATPSCKRRPPKLPKDRLPGPEFEPMDPEELKMQKMMATMKVGSPVLARLHFESSDALTAEIRFRPRNKAVGGKRANSETLHLTIQPHQAGGYLWNRMGSALPL